MLLLFRFLLCSGLLCSTVFGTDPSASSSSLTRTSYARGDVYGCSEKFFRHHCWKYCDGSSGKWCYTVKNSANHCTDDSDCRYAEACQGWCAWNSQSGCSKACHEEVAKPQPSYGYGRCRRGQPYWDCQSSYGEGWRSGVADGGKWISADIKNENVMNRTANTIKFNGNIVHATDPSTATPQSALWFPMGQIKVTSTSLYWTFTIRETGTSSTSTVYIGISDLNKLAPGWGVKGLFYGGNLSDGSGLLAGNFGPKLQAGDKCSILVKIVDSRIKMYIILNGTSLGLAFDVPMKTLEGIYPVVKFMGEGSVEIEESPPSDAPTVLEPVQPLVLEGNWTLQSLGNTNLKDNIATMRIFTTYDRVYARAFRIRIQAVNKFTGRLTERSPYNWVFEMIDKTETQGTTMQMEFENKLVEHVNGIKNLIIDPAESEVRLEANDGTSLWKQFEPTPLTITFNPFDKSYN